jgi:hypothetical protein
MPTLNLQVTITVSMTTSTSTSTLTCTVPQQKQANDYTSSQHRIPSSEQPPSKRVGEVTKSNICSDAFCFLPAPAKFCRKTHRLERAASADKTSIADNSKEAQRKYIYTAHRQYVNSLISQTETFDESSSHKLWADFERLCEIN